MVWNWPESDILLAVSTRYLGYLRYPVALLVKSQVSRAKSGYLGYLRFPRQFPLPVYWYVSKKVHFWKKKRFLQQSKVEFCRTNGSTAGKLPWIPANWHSMGGGYRFENSLRLPTSRVLGIGCLHLSWQQGGKLTFVGYQPTNSQNDSAKWPSKPVQIILY